MNSKYFDFFLKSKQDIADGIKFADWEKYDWGIKFIWENNPLLTTNFAFVNENLDSSHQLINWLKQDNSRKIISKLELQIEFKTNLISLLKGSSKGIKSPVFNDYNMRKFTFHNRDLKYGIDHFTKETSNLYPESQKIKNEIDNYFRALIHMQDGEIWILENSNGNILGGLVTSNYEFMGGVLHFIDTVITKDTTKFPEIRENIIQHYISTSHHDEIITLSGYKSEDWIFLSTLGFEEIERFSLHANTLENKM